ncbi:MAG: hypothetical protein IT532_01640 [Burkholderiales bacterium]|nr:hypothetical protein [Burkholderiales bacterium]
MQPRTSWLFPLMVFAAAAAIAFGALGILAITDRAPALTFPSHPLNRSASPQQIMATTSNGQAGGEVAPAAPALAGRQAGR